MDESMTAQALVLQISEVARIEHCNKVLSAKVLVGACAVISTDYLRQSFVTHAQGTVAEGARLEIAVMQNAEDPCAQEVILQDVEAVC